MPGMPSLFVSRRMTTEPALDWATNRSPFGADIIVRGASRLSANRLTVKPAGACNCTASGLATIVAAFRTDGVANGSASFASCAPIKTPARAVPIKKNSMICLIFIACSSQIDFGRERCRADDGVSAFDNGLPAEPPLLEEWRKHTIPPHDGSGNEKDNRSETDEKPKSFDGPPTEPAKVETRDPSQNLVTAA